MTTVDRLWYLADEASQQAEVTYHRLADGHEGFLEFTTERHVSRPRFRTVANRIRDNGLPYGVHTLAYRPDARLLLVYHDHVQKWVLPGGELDANETFREGARRELREEAGTDVDYDGMGILARVRFHCDGHDTWGVLPIYEGQAVETTLSVSDPDGEITDVDWFDDLPANTRDKEQIQRWRRRRFS